ncbi:hypothetical protein SAMN04488694_11427 [Natrinema hispanicum]|uniref:Uncharacterized protein n=1 Tax=Natrinema hispanicum TaxID=392421 RepID=A0A1I0HKD5_9EURY|nr:hypothetical protein SAMN04488694_11427 [Natrinema hispanicum]
MVFVLFLVAVIVARCSSCTTLLTGWCVWVFVPLEASLKYLYLLLLCSELAMEKTVLELLNYELLAEMRTVLGADRGIYRFRRSANPQRHTWFTIERPFMRLLRNRSDGKSLSNYNKDTPKDVISDRMDVSREVLDKHYNKQSKDEQMKTRRRLLEDL